MAITLECLGSSREVGRSGFVLDTGNEKILLDYGIKVTTGMEDKIDEPEFPLDAPTDLDGVVVSHAHMDHGGYVPSLFNRGYNGPVHATATTFDLMDMLLQDSMKLADMKGYDVGYTEGDVKDMKNRSFRTTYGQEFTIGDANLKFYDAGHLPGSAQVLIQSNGKNIVYTGDIKMEDTELLEGLDPVKEDVDTLIIESTYGLKEHPDREETEKALVRRIRDTLADDGIALVASFATGRAQELLIVMEKYDIDAPIYVDGMCKQATEIILRYDEFLRYPNMLRRAFRKRAKQIHHHGERKNAIKHPAVIITTSGMLNGGPIAYYLEQLKDRTDCTLSMTGYQAEGSGGRHLLDTGTYKNEDTEFDVKMSYEKFDFSAHAGQSELIPYIKKVDPDKVVCIHGDESPEFAELLEEEHGFDAVAPGIGDTVTL